MYSLCLFISYKQISNLPEVRPNKERPTCIKTLLVLSEIPLLPNHMFMSGLLKSLYMDTHFTQPYKNLSWWNFRLNIFLNSIVMNQFSYGTLWKVNGFSQIKWSRPYPGSIDLKIVHRDHKTEFNQNLMWSFMGRHFHFCP